MSIGNKQIELSIIVPCFNEQDNISELMDRINKTLSSKKIKWETIFVNDGSTDKTLEVLGEFRKKFNNICIVNHTSNFGIATSWRDGLQNSQGKLVCIIDADLQYQPEDIYRLYREMKWTSADVIQGIRSHIGRQKGIRYFWSIALNHILNTIFNMQAKDNKSNFILCRKEVFEDILTTKEKYKYFQTFITVAAKSKGYSVKEVETLFEKRMMGESFLSDIPIKVIISVFIDITKAIREYRFIDNYDHLLHEYALKIKLSKESLSIWRISFFKIYQLLIPFHHWMVNKNAFRYHLDLRKTQWLKQKDIKEFQFTKLKKIVNQAYYHVPYYREKFDKLKIKPEDIKSLDDLIKIPYLEKDDVRKNLFFSLFSDNYDKNKILRVTTSGSTGEPLVLFVDREQLNLRYASTLRGMEWAGYRFGDKQVRLWHQTIGMSNLQVFREKLDAFLCRRLFIPAYTMNLDNIEKTLDKIKNYNPTFMDGYAESLNLLANYIQFSKLSGLKIKGVISSAQTLSESSRKIIEKELKTKVYDKYGSREFSGIAYQCDKNNGHHVNAESYIVEIIKNNKPAKPGEIGEVIITDLTNMCMPIIRYRLGDLAEAMDNAKTCKCGRGLPKIGEIEGRIQAIIVGKNNQLIPGTFFAHLLKDYWYAIKQFQVIQEKLGEITLKVIKGGRYSDKILEKIVKEIQEYIGQDTKINIQFVDQIPLGRTGKHYHSISKLNLNFQKLANNLNL